MIYRFNNFELDDALYELRRDGEVRPLQRKAFDLLRYLVIQARRVVSKEEIFDEIWPSLVVSENVLPVAIRTIRLAIEDGNGELLRTVRGRGYQITCSVTQHPSKPEEHAGLSAASQAQGPRFVGRRQPLEALLHAFDLAAERSGQVVFLYGDRGLGKSRLLQEFAGLARERTAFVFEASCKLEEGEPDCWPWIRIAAQVHRAKVGPEVPERLYRAPEVEETGGPFRALFDPSEGNDVSEAELRFRFARMLSRSLERLCAAQQVVLLLDDLHEADAGSLHVSGMLMREIASRRVLIVASCNPAELPSGSRAAYAVADLAKSAHVEQIELDGLAPAEVEELVKEEIGAPAPAALVEWLLATTLGNPFFLRELSRVLAHRESLEPPLDLREFELPATIRDVLLHRVHRVSEECRGVFGWAAAAGNTFGVPLLEKVTGLAKEVLFEHLESAEVARIVSSYTPKGRPRPPGEFGFHHPLLASALYQGIATPDRLRYHRTIGRALEDLYGKSSPQHAEELARHFFKAAPAGEVDRAVHYADLAAESALARRDYAAAVGYQQNRLHAESLRVPRDDERYNDTLMGLGEALVQAGRHEAARRTFLRAADLARSRDDSPLLARAALEAAGGPFRRIGPGYNQDLSHESLIALLEEVCERVDPSDAILRSKVLGALARSLGSDPQRGISLAEDAVALARESGSHDALMRALLAYHSVLHLPQYTERRLGVANEAVELAMAVGEKTYLAQAYAARIPVLFALGEMAPADRDINELAALARRIRLPAYSYGAACFQMCRAAGSGQFDEAQALLERVVRLAREARDPAATWISGAVGTFLVSMTGDFERIRSSLGSLALQEEFEGPTADAFIAHFCMVTGDAADAREHFEKALGCGIADYPRTGDWLWNLCSLSDVAVYLQDRARCDALYEALLPYEHLNVVNRMWAYRGSLGSVLARLALARGDISAARRHMEHAIEFNRAIGATVTVLINRFFYAIILKGGSDEDRARAQEIDREVMIEAKAKGLVRFLSRYR